MANRRKKDTASRGSSILAGICLMLFIFSAAVVIVLNLRWLYYLDVTLLGLDRYSGMSVQAIRENYDALISYNALWHRAPLVFPGLGMSREGAIHFADVKRIFDLVQVLVIVTGIGSVFAIVRMKRSHSRKYLKIAGVGALVVPCVLGILAVFSWETFFVRFHELFFSNDYWLFDPVTDPVIKILPEEYFMHCAVLIGILILLGSLICLRLAKNDRKG